MRHRDARQLHVGEGVERGQLDVGQHGRHRLGQLFLKRLPRPEQEPRQLPRRRALGLGNELRRVGLGQLLAQVAFHQIGEPLVGEAGAQEPPREDGVEREPAEPDADASQRLHLRLGVGHHLRRVALEPAPERVGDLVGPGRLDRRVCCRESDTVRQPTRDRDRHTERTAGRMRGHPAGQGGGIGLGRRRRRHDRRVVRRGVDLAGGLEDARQERAEFEPGEDVAHSLRVDRLHGEVGRAHGELHVTQERVEGTVATHYVDVLAQIAAHDALDFARPFEERVERTELRQPLDRRLLPHLRDAGQVVARLSDEGSDVGVVVGRQAVLLDDRLGCVALELRDALHVRVQERHVICDELDRIAVAGTDEHVEALCGALGRECREDVVGFDALLRQHGHVHRREALLQQGDLTLELGRRLRPIRLVLGVLLGAEGVTRRVERDGEVRRLLGLEKVDEHRQEPVDAIGVLPVLRREVVDREGEEGAVGQRMAVDDEKGRLSRVRHPASLDAATDTPISPARR